LILLFNHWSMHKLCFKPVIFILMSNWLWLQGVSMSDGSFAFENLCVYMLWNEEKSFWVWIVEKKCEENCCEEFEFANWIKQRVRNVPFKIKFSCAQYMSKIWWDWLIKVLWTSILELKLYYGEILVDFLITLLI
jgi:hypothetical protein